MWVGNTPLHNSPLAVREPFLCMCGWGGLLASRTRNVWSSQGPAFSLTCPAILVLEFQSTGNESPTPLPWVGGAPISLLPHLDMPEHTHKHVDPRLAGNRKLMMLTTDYLTTNQSEECP